MSKLQSNIKTTRRQKQPKQQQSFFPPAGDARRKDHGGSLAVRKRRSKRPLKLKQSHHVTLKSYHAVGKRSLFRHKKLILGIIKKFSLRFNVRVYEYAIQGNHIHLLVKAQTRFELQNFFRVVAGHSAQQILKLHPLSPGGAPTLQLDKKRPPCLKNQRKFWSFLLYSRVVTWGREFRTVVRYIQRNALELLQLIAYQPRRALRTNTS